MKQLQHLSLSLAILFLCSACDKENSKSGCRNPNANNFDPAATQDCNCCEFTYGNVVFYLSSENSESTNCGPEIIVKVGSATTVKFIGTVGEPSSCDSTQPGYARLPIGEYSFFVGDPGKCDLLSGTFSVKEGCNKILLP